MKQTTGTGLAMPITAKQIESTVKKNSIYMEIEK